MAFAWSTEHFPSSPQIKARTALPWGCLVQPFSSTANVHRAPASLYSCEVARCGTCFAYVNPLVRFSKRTYTCALCRSSNRIPPRYASAQQRAKLPELSYEGIEFIHEDDAQVETPLSVLERLRTRASASASTPSSSSAAPGAGAGLSTTPSSSSLSPPSSPAQPSAPPPTAMLGDVPISAELAAVIDDDAYPVYMFLVDVSGTGEYLDLVKRAILAALEAIPAQAWVGLCVFSDKVGLYDLRSSVPHVRYTRVLAEGNEPLELALEDMLPLEHALVRLGEMHDNVCSAIESLAPRYPDRFEHELSSSVAAAAPVAAESSPFMDPLADLEGMKTGPVPDVADPPQPAKPRARRRAFGSALDALIGYLASEEYSVCARVLTFLAGRPNYGAGSLPDRWSEVARMAESDPDGVEDALQHALLVESHQFYRERAEVAARAGICTDLYAVLSTTQAPGGAYVDLASLKFLSLLTGGNTFLYSDGELDNMGARDSSSSLTVAASSSLPQDVFRQLRRPQAFRGLLRLRTTPEFQLSSVYGHTCPDQSYDNLFHLAGCDPRKTLACDFEFTPNSAFGGYVDRKPLVQMAFAYTSLERVEDPVTGREVAVPVRRLRIVTRRLQVASSVPLSWKTARTDVALAILTQQLVDVCVEQGVEEAQILLKEWLVNLASEYNRQRAVAGELRSPDQVDVTFDRAKSLRFMTRYVFGLLKSDLLVPFVHPDRRVFLQCLYTGLEPAVLAKAVYPRLLEVENLNSLPNEDALYLAQKEVDESDQPLFLVDAFTAIIVLYTDKAADLPCPPPFAARLRKYIKKLKASTPLISPKVLFARAWQPSRELSVFESMLLEDMQRVSFNFDQFLSGLVDKVASELSQQQ